MSTVKVIERNRHECDSNFCSVLFSKEITVEPTLVDMRIFAINLIMSFRIDQGRSARNFNEFCIKCFEELIEKHKIKSPSKKNFNFQKRLHPIPVTSP
jgi:hypothetical protein